MRLGAIAGILLVLSTAGNAWAQRVDGRGVPYRAWDFNFGVGWVSSAPPTFGFDHYYESGVSAFQTFDLAGQFGHYWNGHLKTELGVLIQPGQESYGLTTSVLPGGSQLMVYYGDSRHRVQLSPAVTWQFLDNTFAHPYVSAGANVGLVNSDRIYSFASIYDGRSSTTVQSPANPGRSTTILTRPFLAAGFKSYFNERTFVRPEMAVTVSRAGLIQVALGFGFGVDF